MALILTFLGKGGTGRTTIAIAAAKKLAGQGKRVLLIGQGAGPALGLLLNESLTADPQAIAANLDVVQLQSTVLLERSWAEVKRQEAEYVRAPFLKAVYGQELGVLPGMDSALALNALREYDASGRYDVILYDGPADQATLRMLGMPEILSWYLRRFRQVLLDSDIVKALAPFVQPLTSAVLNVSWSPDNLTQPTDQINNQLERGKAAIADPRRVLAYLVTSTESMAIATTRYLWGCAQQVNLTVGGVLLNQAETVSSPIAEAFVPLPVTTVPEKTDNTWQPLMEHLPDFTQAVQAPRPLLIDIAERKVSLFLPGFDKKQVKLTQYGPEMTIEAGDQRRNIFLPLELRGRAVTGAKFQAPYLTVSLA